MKTGIKSLTNAVVVGINWALREKSRCELYNRIKIRPFANLNTHFCSEVKIKISLPRPNLLRIDVSNINDIDFPKEDVQTFWERLKNYV